MKRSSSTHTASEVFGAFKATARNNHMTVDCRVSFSVGTLWSAWRHIFMPRSFLLKKTWTDFLFYNVRLLGGGVL